MLFLCSRLKEHDVHRNISAIEKRTQKTARLLMFFEGGGSALFDSVA